MRVLLLLSCFVAVVLASVSYRKRSPSPTSYSSCSSKESVDEFTFLMYDDLKQVMTGLEEALVDLHHFEDTQRTFTRFPRLSMLQNKLKKAKESKEQSSLIKKVTESFQNAFQVAFLILDDAILVGAPTEKTIMPVDRDMTLMPVDPFNEEFDEKVLFNSGHVKTKQEQAKLHAWLNFLMQTGDGLAQMAPYKAEILQDLKDKMSQIATGFTIYREFTNLAQESVEKAESKIREHSNDNLQYLSQTLKLFRRQLRILETKLNKEIQLYNSLEEIKSALNKIQ